MKDPNPMIKSDNRPRLKAAFTATICSMVLNVVLAIGKIVCGFIFGAISVLADGFNNLSDGGSNIITLIGIEASRMPADKEHPYGHARGEYVAAMAVSFIILFLAFELLVESIEKIVEGTSAEFSIASIVVISVSIAVKLSMFVFNAAVGKKYSSQLLLAASTDSLADVFASLAVLASIIAEKFTTFTLDGYVGCLVALLIAISGIKVLKRTISELIGERPDAELVEQIKKRLLSYEGIYGVHSLVVHNYVSKYYVSVHAEIDASVPVIVAHELIDNIEKDFDRDTDIKLTIHLDPVELNDRDTLIMHQKVEELIKELNTSYEIHDFRKIKCNNLTRIVFDVYVPYEVKERDEDIEDNIRGCLYDAFGVEYEYVIKINRGE